MAQMVKNLPAMQKVQILSLGREDQLEKGVATHSSILAWRSPQTEEPGRLRSMGLQRGGQDGATEHIYMLLMYFQQYLFSLVLLPTHFFFFLSTL